MKTENARWQKHNVRLSLLSESGESFPLSPSFLLSYCLLFVVLVVGPFSEFYKNFLQNFHGKISKTLASSERSDRDQADHDFQTCRQREHYGAGGKRRMIYSDWEEKKSCP